MGRIPGDRRHPGAGQGLGGLVRAQCPSVEVTVLPALGPEFWAAVFGMDCPGVEVCDLCGKLTCPGGGPSMVVFLLPRGRVTVCQKCLGHGPDHYTDPDRARTARQQALERARERRRSPYQAFRG